VPDLAALIEQALDGHATDDFGWRLHRNTETAAHLLLTCEPDGMWRTMPSPAVRSAIAQHLTRWAGILAEAGLGAVPNGRDGQPEVLVVADTPAAAETETRQVAAYLTGVGGGG